MTAFRALLWKELLAEWRSREAVSAMLFFATTALLIFSFAFDLTPIASVDVVPAILWVTLVLASLLGLNRSVQREQEHGAGDGMMLAPVPRGALYGAKVIANLLFLLLVQAVMLPLLIVFFTVALPWTLIPLLLLGSIGIAAAGTLFATMASNTRLRDVMLPLLLLPMLVPMLIGAVQATVGVMQGDSLADIGSALALIATFDVIFIVLATLLFDSVLEQ